MSLILIDRKKKKSYRRDGQILIRIEDIHIIFFVKTVISNALTTYQTSMIYATS